MAGEPHTAQITIQHSRKRVNIGRVAFRQSLCGRRSQWWRRFVRTVEPAHRLRGNLLEWARQPAQFGARLVHHAQHFGAANSGGFVTVARLHLAAVINTQKGTRLAQMAAGIMDKVFKDKDKVKDKEKL